jgi:uncharacterized damage-inducible protein DinB
MGGIMDEIKRIDDQLRRAFEGRAWHGPSLRELLADVTAEQATARPVPGAHSTWEITLHIAAWHEGVRRRVEGERVELSPEEDWPPVASTSEAAWQDALAALERTHTELRRMVSRLADARLQEMVAGKDHSVYVMLHGLIQHDLYHAGQIALLKKAWS